MENTRINKAASVHFLYVCTANDQLQYISIMAHPIEAIILSRKTINFPGHLDSRNWIGPDAQVW